ncbi:flagellar motor protein MotB [Salinicola tamaricis]|uniref:flagellar motor protein MotB n=1 Tax=Salinicola tamaricis TaxID=1771309 RepID=UPI0030F4A8C7
MSAGGERRPIIVKRKRVQKGGHHGGSWKIAYADFMTALMALFLVLWILSTVSENELESIAEYFRTPLAVALTGGDKNTASTSAIPGGGADPTASKGEVRRIDVREQTRPSDEQRMLRALRDRLSSVIRNDPQLRQLQSQLRMDFSPEGLRVQIVDSDQRPMFELGSDRLEPYMVKILHKIAPVLNEMPNLISISGHTDALPYAGGEKGYSNWELSADRANASRRELIAAGCRPTSCCASPAWARVSPCRAPTRPTPSTAASVSSYSITALRGLSSSATNRCCPTRSMGRGSLTRVPISQRRQSLCRVPTWRPRGLRHHRVVRRHHRVVRRPRRVARRQQRRLPPPLPVETRRPRARRRPMVVRQQRMARRQQRRLQVLRSPDRGCVGDDGRVRLAADQARA